MEEVRNTKYKWLALITIAVGTFMEASDLSFVNISLPILTKVFEVELSVVLWVSVVYILVSTGFTLILGRMGDVYGRNKIYLLGQALFTMGLILCSFAQDITQLILFRVLQGMGGAMMMSMSIAILTSSFPDRERGKAIGINGAMFSIGLLAGPALGGFLLDALDWRAIFYIRVPIGIIGLIMSWLILKEQKKPKVDIKFDIWGAAILFGGLCCLILFFNLGGRLGFTSALALILVCGSATLLTLFVLRERKVDYPLVDLNLFRSRLFSTGNISLGILLLALSAPILLLPFYLIDGLSYSAAETGLRLATVSMASIVVGPISGWLSDKVGSRVLCTAGAALVCLALFLLSGLGAESSDADILPRLIIYGVGVALFFSPNNSSIMGAVPKDRLGTASAMLNTVRQIGNASGMAIAGAIFTSRQLFHAAELSGNGLSPSIIARLSLIGGYQDTFLVAAIICSLAIFASLARGGRFK